MVARAAPLRNAGLAPSGAHSPPRFPERFHPAESARLPRDIFPRGGRRKKRLPGPPPSDKCLRSLPALALIPGSSFRDTSPRLPLDPAGHGEEEFAAGPPVSPCRGANRRHRRVPRCCFTYVLEPSFYTGFFWCFFLGWGETK